MLGFKIVTVLDLIHSAQGRALEMENHFGAGARDTVGFVKDPPTCLVTAGLLLQGASANPTPLHTSAAGSV